MTKLSKYILNKIKKEKIRPTPRWQFVLLHVVLWLAYLLAIIIGALAFSVIFRLIGGVEWEMVRQVKDPVSGFLLILPYVWVILLIIVSFLASRLFKKTKGGYRIKYMVVILSSIAISLILGLMLYFVGVGHLIEDGLSKNVGPYAEWREHRDRFLVAPDKGVLAGEVIEIRGVDELIIIDFKRVEWVVDISGADSKNGFEPKEDYPVGLIGELISEGEFRADSIMPFRPPEPPISKQKTSASKY